MPACPTWSGWGTPPSAALPSERAPQPCAPLTAPHHGPGFWGDLGELVLRQAGGPPGAAFLPTHTLRSHPMATVLTSLQSRPRGWNLTSRCWRPKLQLPGTPTPVTVPFCSPRGVQGRGAADPKLPSQHIPPQRSASGRRLPLGPSLRRCLFTLLPHPPTSRSSPV